MEYVIELIIGVAVFVMTFLGTAYGLNISFQKTLSSFRKDIEVHQENITEKCRANMTNTCELTYAKKTDVNEINITIVKIYGEIKGIKDAFKRFETLLHGGRIIKEEG